jgi:raffinose/stachyose/melibiose transport system permease protein
MAELMPASAGKHASAALMAASAGKHASAALMAASAGKHASAAPATHRAPASPATRATTAQPRWSARRRRAVVAWLFMLPLVVVNGVVILGPGLASVYYSFTSWSGVGTAEWVGLANYQRLLTDSDFLSALVHNLWWTLFFLTVPMAMGLLGARLRHRCAAVQARHPRARRRELPR